MKKLIYLLIFFLFHETIFSQTNVRDGIYLVDLADTNSAFSRSNTSVVKFNPLFVRDEPDDYPLLVIRTDDYVPLELDGSPIVQYQKNNASEVLVNLTKNAAEKLRVFTTNNMMNHIVVVVNGQALVIYKVIQPVTKGFIKITSCNGSACSQIYNRLKATVKI